ncbi:MAG TPA: vitamin K epoxide reductase family protein [Candidatus Paceibacterota bacterium]|nr:vitamin K epoxide reductase family protein [Candidatus Paceibacterota bacterium]
MTNSNNSLTPRLIPKAVWAGMIVALIGFADAFYLTLTHYQNKIPPCTVGGCETVLTSPYATIGSVPISLVGVLYYAAVLGCLMLFFQFGAQKWLRMWRGASTIAFLVTLVLVSLQLFVIHAICLYCMASAIVATTLFVLSLYATKVPKTV